MVAVAEHINVPELRFPEFSGEITQHTIEETLLNSHLGGNYQNTSEPVGFPLIKMGNLKRGYIDVSALDYIIDGAEICEDDLCRKGDLFFNTRNTLELVGKVAIWKNELPVAYFNSNILRLQFSCNGFMNAWFNSAFGRRKLKAIATGTTSVAAIYTRHLLAIQISYPSLPEQQKIADFLTAVDEKIGKLKRKKELLEAYKKGAMQKLFSQEIRFKDDQGNPYPDWEEKRLGEIGVFKTSGIDKKIISGEQLVRLVNYMDVYKKKNIDSAFLLSAPLTSASQSEIERHDLKKGDILFTPSSETPVDIGHSRVVSENLEDAVYSYHLLRLRPTKKLHLGFSNILCQSGAFWNHMHRVATGSTRFTVSKSEFENAPASLPSLPEQQKIAEFLTGIDDKIKAVANQIDQAAEFKKGLLQKMFV